MDLRVYVFLMLTRRRPDEKWRTPCPSTSADGVGFNMGARLSLDVLLPLPVKGFYFTQPWLVNIGLRRSSEQSRFSNKLWAFIFKYARGVGRAFSQHPSASDGRRQSCGALPIALSGPNNPRHTPFRRSHDGAAASTIDHAYSLYGGDL